MIMLVTEFRLHSVDPKTRGHFADIAEERDADKGGTAVLQNLPVIFCNPSFSQTLRVFRGLLIKLRT